MDEEPWIGLAHFSRESEEASKVADRLFCETEEPLAFAAQSPRDFLQQFVGSPATVI